MKFLVVGLIVMLVLVCVEWLKKIRVPKPKGWYSFAGASDALCVALRDFVPYDSLFRVCSLRSGPLPMDVTSMYIKLTGQKNIMVRAVDAFRSFSGQASPLTLQGGTPMWLLVAWSEMTVLGRSVSPGTWVTFQGQKPPFEIRIHGSHFAVIWFQTSYVWFL